MSYKSFTKPQFHPRAQITGVMRYACVYCAYVNIVQLTPTRFKFYCKRCRHIMWHGSIFHIPAGGQTSKAKDSTIPMWIEDGEEFTDDPLKFDPMPEAMMDPTTPIEQRGRVHAIVIHRNVFLVDSPIQDCPEMAEEPERD